MRRAVTPTREFPTFVIAGRLRRNYLLPANSRPLLDVPGGSLLSAAVGLGLWDSSLGLLARVGEDYPHQWLRTFEGYGWDTRGIHILAEALDLRYFQASMQGEGDENQGSEPNRTIQNIATSHPNPLGHFARLGLSFPKSLLGYQPEVETKEELRSVHADSPRPKDIPGDYLNARAVHLCPLEYMTANRLISTFHQAGLPTLTLDPSRACMTAAAFDDMRTLLHGLTAFMPSEQELRGLFWGRTDDLWQMAEELGDFGCEFIIVKCGARGQMLYNSISKKRWEIPAYPARLADLTGAGDAFCGGFLSGYQKTFDPLRGTLQGNISASLTIEGSGAFHALESLPGLAQARLDSLAAIVRQV